jgi:hypothetical protein
MSAGRWIAYAAWVCWWALVAYVVTLAIDGVHGFCLFLEETDTARAYEDAVGAAVLATAFGLVVAGGALERRCGSWIAVLPILCLGVVMAVALVAASFVGEQPCV